jgi:hypothetical protein
MTDRLRRWKATVEWEGDRDNFAIWLDDLDIGNDIVVSQPEDITPEPPTLKTLRDWLAPEGYRIRGSTIELDQLIAWIDKLLRQGGE